MRLNRINMPAKSNIIRDEETAFSYCAITCKIPILQIAHQINKHLNIKLALQQPIKYLSRGIETDFFYFASEGIFFGETIALLENKNCNSSILPFKKKKAAAVLIIIENKPCADIYAKVLSEINDIESAVASLPGECNINSSSTLAHLAKNIDLQ
jgi:hypothetical protein